jgi:hypothetical protein
MDEATQRARTELMSLHAARRKSAYVIALCCVAAIGGFLFGFDSGVINGTVDALAKAFRTDAAGTGFAVASVLLPAAQLAPLAQAGWLTLLGVDRRCS